MRFRSYLDGRERFMGPETSMEVQAEPGLGHRAGLRRVHALPRRARLHGLVHGAHPSLARSLPELARGTRTGRPARLRDRPGRRVRGPARRSRRPTWPARASTGSPSAARWARPRSRCARWSAGRCARCPTRPRAICSASATSTTWCTRWARASTASTAPRPTRLARHGTALVNDPERRWRLDLTKGRHRTSREPIQAGCACPACREHTRGYLHYLIRANELTAKRLLTLHNLTFMAELMSADARGDRHGRVRRLRRADAARRARELGPVLARLALRAAAALERAAWRSRPA